MVPELSNVKKKEARELTQQKYILCLESWPLSWCKRGKLGFQSPWLQLPLCHQAATSGKCLLLFKSFIKLSETWQEQGSMPFLLAGNKSEFHGCEQGMLWFEHGNRPGMWLILTAYISHPLRTPRRLPPHACRAGWAQSRCSYHAGLLPDRVPFHFCSHVGVQTCGCEFLKTRNITFTRVKTPHALKMCKTYCLQSFLWALKPLQVQRHRGGFQPLHSVLLRSWEFLFLSKAINIPSRRHNLASLWKWSFYLMKMKSTHLAWLSLLGKVFHDPLSPESPQSPESKTSCVISISNYFLFRY